MFRPLRLFSKAADPIFCPAALDGQPCIIPQCFFSHEVYLPQPPPAPPPPSKPITAPAPAPTPTEPEDSYEPPPAITPPKKTVDPRLRDIVEGKKITEAKKTQDLVAARDKRPRSVEVQCGAAKDVKDAINSATKGASKAVETGNVSPGASSVIASSDAWPTPAQSSKKLKTSKAGGSDVPVDEFYGNHVCVPLRPGRGSGPD
ncbi:hypothetical protein BZA05DRAFT_270923 [Tricharina praecox]|uniref:uncharacterized protein n=1 Tax=Tricharina praecox TaxID=43433 RepID=UPI002220E0CA|nr:uncharacterized protein BZA05DRAFT_270923 [Tricharina praecox]KAI5853832.1 hypothetical protein BZA05DRAFT_270923 [Tricharina praecox]